MEPSRVDFTNLSSVELTMCLLFSRKYHVGTVSSKRLSKTFEKQKILGTRMGHRICYLIIPFRLKLLQKRRAFSESLIYSEKWKTWVTTGESLLNRIVLFLMNKREWNGNMVGMYGSIYRFVIILLMYIYRKTTKVQAKIVLKTSLEHIFSTIILILIYLPRYFFLILVCLLISVRKNLSVKFVFYRNQSIDLYCKSVDLFLYDTNFHRKIFPNRL